MRAFSARLTRVWIWSVAGGTLAGITAILNQAGSFLRSSIVWLDIAAPKVATMTSTMAGRNSSDVGSEPSMIMKARRATSETTNPIRVAGSTGQRSSRAGKGTTAARAPASSGRDGER